MCSFASAQTVSFTDSNFKNLLVSSSVSNKIAQDGNGNYFAVDANENGEIESSELASIKLLNVKIDRSKMYQNPELEEGFNAAYYLDHLPSSLIDVHLIPNLQELYITDSQSGILSFENNSTIRKVDFLNDYYLDSLANPIQFTIEITIDNCPSIADLGSILGSQPHSYFGGIVHLKNMPHFQGDLVLDDYYNKITELYFEGNNYTSIFIKGINKFKKLNVANSTQLASIKMEDTFIKYGANHYVELDARNCPQLETVVADGDVYFDSHTSYFGPVLLDGSINLKRIKGVNMETVDFSNLGFTHLEELDIANYNRNLYTSNSFNDTMWGEVKNLNLNGLPSLKILKVFNQPLSQISGMQTITNIEEIDITNSASYLTTLDVHNLPKLTSLLAERVFEDPDAKQLPINLKYILAEDCPNLSTFKFYGNYELETINLKNNLSISSLEIGSYGNAFMYMPNFSNLNIENSTGLNQLKIENTVLSNLNTTKTPNLNTLHLGYLNNLSALDVTKNESLQNLMIWNTPNFVETDFSKNTALVETVFFKMNSLKKVDLSNNSNLSTVAFSDVPALEFVNIHNAKVEENVGFENVNSSLLVCVDPSQLQTLQSDFPTINFTTTCESTLSTTSSTKNTSAVYPNPTSDFVHIKSEKSILDATLYDSSGREIIKTSVRNNSMLDVRNLPKGNYILVLKTKDSISTHKISKK